MSRTNLRLRCSMGIRRKSSPRGALVPEHREIDVRIMSETFSIA